MSNTFQGQYVKDVLAALTASAVSGKHLCLIGKPGTGKTAISVAALNKMFGKDNVVITRLNATTPLERVKGVLDVKKYIQDGQYVVNTDGTPYQKGVMAIIADELYRASDYINEEFMFIMDNLDMPLHEMPIVVATSNFFPDNERLEAAVDRFGLWMNVDPGRTSISAVGSHLMSAGKPGIDNGLPKLDKIKKARQSVPDKATVDLIEQFIDHLRDEAERGSRAPDGSVVTFPVNYRRLTQWSDLVYRVSALVHDAPTFTTIPNEARYALRWAWPGMTNDRSKAWNEIIQAVSDPIGAGIDALKATILTKFQEIAKTRSNNRSALSTELGVALSDGQRELEDLARSMDVDPEEDGQIQNAIIDVQSEMARLILGEDNVF